MLQKEVLSEVKYRECRAKNRLSCAMVVLFLHLSVQDLRHSFLGETEPLTTVTKVCVIHVCRELVAHAVIGIDLMDQAKFGVVARLQPSEAPLRVD